MRKRRLVVFDKRKDSIPPNGYTEDDRKKGLLDWRKQRFSIKKL